ncbi:MAG: hypothetical protein JNM56_24540 [Planctomycetia bacterium]|nr:hypothetical protein [Planctomycetia bacterium]
MTAPAAFTAVWFVLLAALVAHPLLTDAATFGSDLIRNTIRLSLLYYAPAAALLLLSRAADWRAFSPRLRLARCCWSLAWLSFVIHVVCAFHYFHRWSHEHALAHTLAVAGWAEGIFVSHCFTLVWTVDVLAWWLFPRWYAARSPWLDRVLHGFMAFILFNGSVVFEGGVVRWASAVMFAGLAVLFLMRRVLRRQPQPVL